MVHKSYLNGCNCNSESSASVPPATKSKPETSPTTTHTTKVTTPGTILEHQQLPKKYARKPLSNEEMEFIQV